MNIEYKKRRYERLGMDNRKEYVLEDYVFEDTIPYIPEIDLEELKNIENKLKNYTSGKSKNGLTPQEAEIFLDWISFNARKYAVGGKDTPEFMDVNLVPIDPMSIQCAPTQKLNVELLRKIGLDAKPFNTADCMGDIQMSLESQKRRNNGFDSPAVRHSVSMVSIPIIDNLGNTAEYKYLLDPTFRQFCLKENCNEDQYREFGNTVAPHPGYFMQANNLQQLGIPEDIAQKTETLGKLIVSRGYFCLNDENVKLYMDTFRRASTNKRYQFLEIENNIKGQEYIRKYENIPMQMTTLRKGDKYFKLPSEIEDKKKSVFSKIKDYLKKIFNKSNMNALPLEVNFDIPSEDPCEFFRKQYKGVNKIDKEDVQNVGTIVIKIRAEKEL